MPSNKEILSQDHICDYLETAHHYRRLSKDDLGDQEFHFIEKHLVEFICATQKDKYDALERNYTIDANREIVEALRGESSKKIEYFYRDALTPEMIAKYLEHFLVFVPAVDKSDANGVRIVKGSLTIFPRFHQLRAAKKLADDVKESFEKQKTLGNKYLINHSAGSGKTLTIAWMADLLDSLYNANNENIFDNIIILTDRRSLDKNVKDDLEKFGHLSSKVCFTKRSGELARFLELDRDIIVSTIHKFSYIQDKLKNSEELKKRKVAFLIDEAHRSQLKTNPKPKTKKSLTN